MLKMLVRWFAVTVTLLALSQIFEGFIVDGVYYALAAAFIIGVLNTLIRPILFILTLPVNILTLGLFTFVINAAIIWFVASFVEGFVVQGFIPALGAAIVLWMVSLFIDWIFKMRKK